jgi:hypothetical protein
MTPAERRAIERAERDGSLAGFADLLEAEHPSAAEYLRARSEQTSTNPIRTKAACVLAYEWLREHKGIVSQPKRIERILPYARTVSEDQVRTAIKQADAAVNRFLTDHPDFDWQKHLRVDQTFSDPDCA